MRTARIKPSAKFSVFYSSSSTTDSFPDFDSDDRDELQDLIIRASTYLGLELIAWVITARTFRVLLSVPRKTKLSDAEIVTRVSAYYGEEAGAKLVDIFDNESAARCRAARQREIKKMGDISNFFKLVCQDYTISLTKRTGQLWGGKVWYDRFKSIPVENSPEYIMKAAIRLHTAPVDEGLCEKADQYEHSSLFEACKNKKGQRDPILDFTEQPVWRDAIALYRREIVAYIKEADELSRKRQPSYLGSKKFGKAVKEQHASGRNGRSFAESQAIAAKRIASLKRFKKKFGHGNIPLNWEKDPELARWLYIQRRKHILGKLSAAMVSQLEALGVDWDAPTANDLKWEHQYQKLCEIKKQTGELYFPSTLRIYAWSQHQRSCRDKGLLSEERIKKLDKIGFLWNKS